MNGTTVMHMFAVTFIATAAGIDVTPANMIVMAFLSICAAAGTPAIPIAGTTTVSYTHLDREAKIGGKYGIRKNDRIAP